jgi:hypothetical protein
MPVHVILEHLALAEVIGPQILDAPGRREPKALCGLFQISAQLPVFAKPPLIIQKLLLLDNIIINKLHTSRRQFPPNRPKNFNPTNFLPVFISIGVLFMFDIQGLLQHHKIHNYLVSRYSLVTYLRGLTLGTVIEINGQRSEVSFPAARNSQIFRI